MLRLAVTRFAPAELLLIPAGKEGTAFTPYALLILAVGCMILFIVSVLQERGIRIRETLSRCSLPVTVAIYFLPAVIHWFLRINSGSKGIYLCTVLKNFSKAVLVIAVCTAILILLDTALYPCTL